MATFLMYGSYAMDAIGKISAKRTKDATALIQELGGTIKGGYATLGKHDLVLIVELPGNKEAMKASAGLAKMLGISFTTAPAISVEEFDKLMKS